MPARKLLSAVAALLVCAVLSACQTLHNGDVASAQKPPLILISIDGFRADYLQRGYSPNLKALADGGANAAMRPSFPSLTFPNHYTLVTGLVPDHHGVVANSMLDVGKPGVKFMMSNNEAVTDGYWWDGGTPMWVTAEKAGKKVGVEFWPGSEAEIDGRRPSYFSHYDGKVTNEQRVDQILAWMDLPADQRPAAYLLYFDAVDHQGHDFGPDSAEVNEAVAQVDSAIGRLRDGLKSRGVAANMIIVADHGMAAISPDRAYFLEDYLPKDSYDAVVTGPEALINPLPGHEADLDALTKKTFEHMHCWHKADIPTKFNYGKNPRIPEVMCLGDVGWLVANTHEKGIGYKAGAHGYDQTAPEVAALFIANGPGIKPGVKLPGFDNVDVYSLEMKLLGVKPERSDGSLTALKPALK